MDSSVRTRRPCFIEEDDGLASLADMEAGFSATPNHTNNTTTQIKQQHHLISRPFYYSRKTSLGNLSFPSSPRCGRFFDARYEQPPPHFLHACFLCKTQLGHNKDIFMYRGDTPFCSEECRQEQIERDEAKEKKWNPKALRNKSDQNKSTNSSSTKKDYAFRTGAVAAA